MTKLRALFIVVITLFGVMNIGAMIGYIVDTRERKRLCQQLRRPEADFLEVEGVWTWRFRQLPLDSPVEAPRGSAPTLAFLMGMPLIRLRMALPDEMLSDAAIGAVLGRADGLSLDFMNTDGHHLKRMLTSSRSRKGLPAAGAVAVGQAAPLGAGKSKARIPAMVLDYAGAARRGAYVSQPPAARAEFKQERMAGTALVLAFMSVNNVLPAAEMAHRKQAACNYFRGVRIPGVHHDFKTLLRLLMGLLIEGNLGQRKRWLEKARLWRIVLLQRPDGSFSLTQSLAVATEAHAPCDTIKVSPPSGGWFKRFKTARRSTERLAARLSQVAGVEDVDIEGYSDGDLGVDDEDVLSKTAKEKRSDDPLQFSREAMQAYMPRALADLAKSTPASRFWATLLALVTLEEMPISWLASEDEDPVERTVVDAADAYLRAQAEYHPDLDELLRSGELHKAARRARKQWSRLMDAKVGAVRSAELTKETRSFEHAERASARIMLSMLTEHDQISTFLDESDAIMRWQRWMILMTLVCSALLVSIWFYQSRSAQCCTEIRAVLNCESTTSCLGFTGSCSDLQQQFATLQGPFMYGTPPSEHADLSEYECHAFPDDASPTDQLLVALINIAISIPSGMVLYRCFEIANEGEDWPDAWLELPRGMMKLVFQLVYGQHVAGRWHYSTPPLERDGQPPARHVHDVPPCRSDFLKWYVRHSVEVPTMWLVRFLQWAWALLTGAARRELDSEHEAEKDADADGEEIEVEDEGAVDALTKRLYAAAGMLGIYVSWAIYSWFIFTYGMLIYRQLGDQAQRQFSKCWGVNFGLDSVKEWQDVGQEAVKTAFILILLDMLHIMGHRAWLEEHLDHMCMQAALFNGAAYSWWQRTWRLVQQQKRLNNE